MDSFRFPLRGSNKRGARIGTTPDRPSTIDFLFGIPPLLISFELYSLSLFLFFFASFLERGEIEIFFLSPALILRYISRILALEFIRERERLAAPFFVGRSKFGISTKAQSYFFFSSLEFSTNSLYIDCLCQRVPIFSLNRVGIVKENIDRRAIGGDIDRGGREFT